MARALRLILDTNRGTREYVVPPESGAVIGRRSDCDIVILDTTASRHHTRVEVVDGAWHVRDLDSSNGTKLNGQPVALARISNGDELKVGQSIFSLVLEEEAAAVEKAPEVGVIPIPPDVLPSKKSRRRRDNGTARASRKRPAERGRSSGRSGRKSRRSGREREDAAASRRTRRIAITGQPFYTQTPVIIGASVVLVLLIIVGFSVAGSRRQSPLPPPGSARPATDFNAMGAQELYSEASRLMSRKQYNDALPVVQAALKKFIQLRDDPQCPKWVEDKCQQLIQWEHKLLWRKEGREGNSR